MTMPCTAGPSTLGNYCSLLTWVWVAVVFANGQECEPVRTFTATSNNKDWDGTCQVYPRGQAPCKSDSSQLSEATGWFVVVGFGLFFTALTIAFMQFERRKKGIEQTSELFNTGGRNIGTSLTASAITAKWVWAASLLMSSNMGWSVGISGAFWYASGATIPILLFSVLAVQLKRRASHAHTFLEIVKVRFGTVPHLVMICFALTTNVIVTSMLILGGASTIEDLTGMNKIVAGFLIPLLSCWLYTMYGGLRTTFFASYIHCATIFLVLIMTLFSVYTGSGELDLWGSSANVYAGATKASVYGMFEATLNETQLLADPTSASYFDGLGGIMGNDGTCYDKEKKRLDKSCDFKPQPFNEPCCSDLDWSSMSAGAYCRSDTADCVSVSSKKHYRSSQCDFDAGERCVPSFMTMGSTSGAIFGITNIVGNFGTVFVDQSYWQSAFAAKPRSAAKGFLIAGMTWFAVPFCMATATGLAARAFTTHPDMNGVIGARYIDSSTSGAGLTPPRVLAYIMGPFGAFVLLLQLFMAITSTGSAEIIAVSSIMTYDVYYEYIEPELKLRREKLRRIFFTEVQFFVEGASKDSKVVDLQVFANREKEVRISLVRSRVALAKCQELLNALVLKGFFDKAPKEAEIAELALMLMTKSIDGHVLVPEFWASLNKAASSNNIEGKILLRVSRFFTGAFAMLMGFLTVFLFTMGLSLGHVYMSMGCLVGSAVGPVALSILYEKTNGKAVAAGSVVGLLLAMLGWVLRALDEFGTVEYNTLMADWPWVVGNLCALIGGTAIAVIGSVLFPDDNFRWSMIDDQIALVDDVLPPRDLAAESDEQLKKQYNIAVIVSLILTAILIILWPVPQHLFGGVMGTGSFSFWVAVVFIWGIVAAGIVILFPLWEFYQDFNIDTLSAAKNTDEKKKLKLRYVDAATIRREEEIAMEAAEQRRLAALAEEERAEARRKMEDAKAAEAKRAAQANLSSLSARRNPPAKQPQAKKRTASKAAAKSQPAKKAPREN